MNKILVLIVPLLFASCAKSGPSKGDRRADYLVKEYPELLELRDFLVKDGVIDIIDAGKMEDAAEAIINRRAIK